ncbi:hypothetical protein GCM10025865_03070 [Paraoerskovia sediminicola]|uniref:MATE family efflux transporter n=1 Tax=Paraoerskovia sediminicola TaxID=1138587 RepID=A0ABM8FZD1_9CELL|nr:hypothetical protein GCM10025865_03070 [Paraoerskovia sediminicola]
MVTFGGTVALMFFNYLSSIIRAIGDSRTPLYFLVACCVLNAGLTVLLVGALGLGVGGAAAATVASQAVSVVLCLAYVRLRVPELLVRRGGWRVSRGDYAQHLRLGLPMGLQMSIIAIGTLVVQFALNELGADAVAAYTTAARVDGIAVALLGSLGLAVSMFVAQNRGARRDDRIRQGVRHGVIMAVVGSAALGAVLVLWGTGLVELFVGPGQGAVVDMAGEFLTVNGALYSVLGVLFVVRGALQGLGRSLVPTVSGFLELVMRSAAAVVLGGAFGYSGVVWSNPLAWAGSVCLLVPAYLAWQRRHVGASDRAVEDGGAEVCVRGDDRPLDVARPVAVPSSSGRRLRVGRRAWSATRPAVLRRQARAHRGRRPAATGRRP